MINLALIGTGRISEWVLQGALQEGRMNVVAVCSRKHETAEAFIRKNLDLQKVKIYTSVSELVKDSGIDAVYIGTPNETHCAYAIECLNAGKHVICEKPLAVSAAEGRMMAEAAESSGCVLMEAMISTLNPNFRAAVSKFEDIAPIRHYSSHFCQYSSKFEALKNGVVASSFRPGAAGALRDIGIYALYPLVSVFGRPESVRSAVRLFLTPEGYTDVSGSLFLKYKEMDAVLTYSKVYDSFLPTEISGDGGNIILDAVHIARRVELVPHGVPSSGQGPKSARILVSEGLEHNHYYYEFKEFADVIEGSGRESEINNLQTSIEVLEIMDEVLQSVADQTI